MKNDFAPIPSYTALNPRGYLPEIKRIPLSLRPETLDRKTIYIINSWREGAGLEVVFSRITKFLEEQYLGINIISMNKPSPYPDDDTDLWKEMVAKADAFIYGAAPSCSTTAWAVTWAAGLERRGLPGIVLIFDTLEDDAQVTSERLGTPLRWVSVPYPADTLSDPQLGLIIAAVKENLIRPVQPEEKRTDTWLPDKPNKIACKGIIEEIQDFFIQHGWSDGLPIVPPTEELVGKMLQGTTHAPDEVVVPAMAPENWQVTVEKVAINAVMAGCLPVYMPVLLASVEAYCQSDPSSTIRSTNSFSYMQVVNGPIRHEIGMNAGTFALGPGNRANATIGRALNLFITNLGGGQIGINRMGTQGNVSSYSFCFAENEEAMPWESFAVEKGFAPDESVLSLFGGGWFHTGNYFSQPIEVLAQDMATVEFPMGIAVLMAPERARLLFGQGFTKAAAKHELWSKATTTLETFRAKPWYKVFIEPVLDQMEVEEREDFFPKAYLSLPAETVVPVFPRKFVDIVVVGGEVNPMMQGWLMSRPMCVSIDKWR